MTDKPETVADVLADERKCAEAADYHYTPADLKKAFDRIERALSAQTTDSRTPIMWREDTLYGLGYSASEEFYSAFPDFPNPPQPAKASGSAPDGMIDITTCTPPDGELVLVYTPDNGDGERYDFDYWEDGGWAIHAQNYDHFVMVGGSAAAGPDCVCVGPSEEAPYTHWSRLPKPVEVSTPPASAPEEMDSIREKIEEIANNLGETVSHGCDQDAVNRVNGYVDELFALTAALEPEKRHG